MNKNCFSLYSLIFLTSQALASDALQLKLQQIYKTVTAGDATTFKTLIANCSADELSTPLNKAGKTLLSAVASMHSKQREIFVYSFHPNDLVVPESVRKNYRTMCSLLLEKGVNADNGSALNEAVCSDTRICELLLQHGATVDGIGNSEVTPLGIALSPLTRSNSQICKILLDSGACLDTRLKYDKDSKAGVTEHCTLLHTVFKDHYTGRETQQLIAQAYVQRWLAAHQLAMLDESFERAYKEVKEVVATKKFRNEDDAVTIVCTKSRIPRRFLKIDEPLLSEIRQHNTTLYNFIRRQFGKDLQKTLVFALQQEDFDFAHVLLNNYYADNLTADGRPSPFTATRKRVKLHVVLKTYDSMVYEAESGSCSDSD